MTTQATVPAMNVSTALDADAARSQYGIDGTGSEDRHPVGAASTTLGGAAAQDEADGWLPTADKVDVVQGLTAGGTADEGRAMAEMVHAIAPGASIDFYSPSGQDNGIGQGIQAMQADGCSVICDDITRSDEPYWQLGALDEQAIKDFTRSGGVYFTDASNAGTASARQDTVSTLAANLPGIGAVQAVDLGTGSGGAPGAFATFTVGNTRPVSIDLQWSQPWQSLDGVGTAYSIGLAIYDASGNLVANVAEDQDGPATPCRQVGSFEPARGRDLHLRASTSNGGARAVDGRPRQGRDERGRRPAAHGRRGPTPAPPSATTRIPDAITVGAVEAHAHGSAYGGDLLDGGRSARQRPAPTCCGTRREGCSQHGGTGPGTVDVSAPDAPADHAAGRRDRNPYYGTSAATPVGRRSSPS